MLAPIPPPYHSQAISHEFAPILDHGGTAPLQVETALLGLLETPLVPDRRMSSWLSRFKVDFQFRHA